MAVFPENDAEYVTEFFENLRPEKLSSKNSNSWFGPTDRRGVQMRDQDISRITGCQLSFIYDVAPCICSFSISRDTYTKKLRDQMTKNLRLGFGVVGC